MITLLSKDRATIAKFLKSAKNLGVQLVPPPAVEKPLPDVPVLADADSYPANSDERATLIAELCVHATKAPTACFGHLFNNQQRAALDKAGVVFARGPGLVLLRTLASWGALAPEGSVLAPDAE
jgi:hypothetical protein